MDLGRAVAPLAVGLALLARGNAAVAQPTSSEVITGESSVVVDVFKRGVFSPFLHDHHLRFSQVRGSRMEVLERSGTAANGTVRGTLIGTLELRGRTKPIRVPIAATFEAPVMRAKGQAELRQTDFGIDPYSTALGTIGVEDRLEVHFDISARRTRLALR
jgi:hypothetical protein